MFENMMKYEKAWRLFCEWLKNKYDYEYLYFDKCINYNFGIDVGDFGMRTYCNTIHDDFILFIMPFFFDEYDIELADRSKFSRVYCKNNVTYEYFNNDRLSSMIDSRIKAFEILNNNL